MKNTNNPPKQNRQVIGIPLTLLAFSKNKEPKFYLPSPVNTSQQSHNILNSVKLGLKIKETVKGKLRSILQGRRGIENIFKRQFSFKEGEKLLKASHCCLSTTAGPISGLLFITTHKVSFCSQNSIKVNSPNGELVKVHYKVSIPLAKIMMINESQNVERPLEKYIEIVTEDEFEFWFMGFLNHKKALRHLHQACQFSEIQIIL